jgi:2-dehydropantoate 2-reductase
MHQAGHTVHLCLRSAAQRDHLRQHGLWLTGPRGDWPVQVQVHLPSDLPTLLKQPVDVVLSAVKLVDATTSARDWALLLERAGAVVSLQNGIDGVDRLQAGAPGMPAQRLWRGLAWVAGQLESPGLVRYRSALSSLQLGGQGALADPVLTQWRQQTHHAVHQHRPALQLQLEVVENIALAQWTKFALLATNASLTCLTRQPAGVIYHDTDLLALARQSITEVTAVAAAQGVALPATLMVDTLAILQAFPADLYASMHHDLAAGKPLELDGICGLITRLGRQHGVPTPFHDMAWACLKPWMKGAAPRQASAVIPPGAPLPAPAPPQTGPG